MAMPEDERAIYRAARHMRRRRMPAAALGGLLTLLALAGLYLAYVKHIPFTGHGYELEATFRNAVDVSTGSPVRIAGVNVGEVLGTEQNSNVTTVRFNIEDDGRPVNADATVKLRPRMFFEGNWFLDLDPGSPSAPELDHGDSIPMSRTATAVQFDEVLNTLQAPVRDDLGDLLFGYGYALTRVPTPADDLGFEPFVQGKSAAEAINLAFEEGELAGRSSSRVLEALRGTEPHDLSRLIATGGRTFEALSEHEAQLQDLITNWNRFTGALAAESANLEATFVELAPTLETAETSLDNLNRTLPPLRTWAREIEPAVAELPALIEAGGPWLDEARPLLQRSEAGGLVRMLRRAMPGLAGAADASLDTLPEISNLSLCTTQVLIPTGDQVILDRFSNGEPNYREFFYSTVNIAGESQTFDGNGPMLRLQPAVGDVLTTAANPQGEEAFGTIPPASLDDKTLFSHTTVPPLGTQPQLGPRPPMRPDVKCQTNAVPDLNAGLGTVGPPSPAPVP
jgi:phospholipid/cholesterol/gamma-HCH transport system substrate-binding protein